MKWDKRFLRLAAEIASWSKDPSTKVGAVIVRPDRTVASMGYNGFPRAFIDKPALYSDRVEKYKYVVHAEANAIVTAKEPLTGYSLYTYPLPPCNECMKLVIQAGITRWASITPNEDQLSRMKESFDAAEHMSRSCGLTMVRYPRNLIDD